MYKKIMVAIDDGETAKQALVEAEHIANIYNAEFCIVYAITNNTEDDRESGTEILAQAKLSVNTLNVESCLLEAECEYSLNGIVEAITIAATDWEADLLIVGTANRRGLERFVVGSVAEQLLSRINCSILLVRPQKI